MPIIDKLNDTIQQNLYKNTSHKTAGFELRMQSMKNRPRNLSPLQL